MSKKTILITGSTDGIGLETAKRLVSLGHKVLLHGRNVHKLETVEKALHAEFGSADIEVYSADFSRLTEVQKLAEEVSSRHSLIDALINNAGVFMVSNPLASEALDIRFVVNTIAPFLLTKRLIPIMNSESRVINLSSAAQSSVDLEALEGSRRLTASEAYAQSKLGLTMWSRFLADQLGPNGPAIIAVNPGSFLGSKMVKEAYGQAGKDIGIGADILVRAVMDGEFAKATGKYFDNDLGSFASPHPDANNSELNRKLVAAMNSILQVAV